MEAAELGQNGGMEGKGSDSQKMTQKDGCP